MPPSGFSKQQSEFITNFLKSCGFALKSESISLGRTPKEGLLKEINDINQYISNSNNPTANHLLNLTRNYYEELLQENPEDFESFEKIMLVKLDIISNTILDIKVE